MNFTKASGPIQIGKYTISIRRNHKGERVLWIEQEDGEGMETNTGKFEAIIDDFWEQEF